MIATKSSHRLPGLCGTWRWGHLWCAKHPELGGCHDQHPLGAGTAWAWHTRGWGERKLLPVWSVVSSEPRTPQEPCLAMPSPAPPCPTLSVPEAPAPDPHCSQPCLLGLPSQLGALEPAHSEDCPAPTPALSLLQRGRWGWSPSLRRCQVTRPSRLYELSCLCSSSSGAEERVLQWRAQLMGLCPSSPTVTSCSSEELYSSFKIQLGITSSEKPSWIIAFPARVKSPPLGTCCWTPTRSDRCVRGCHMPVFPPDRAI